MGKIPGTKMLSGNRKSGVLRSKTPTSKALCAFDDGRDAAAVRSSGMARAGNAKGVYL
jgi:hypothetical protein